MSFLLGFIKDQLKTANRLKVLELCLKYPEQEKRIKREYSLAKAKERG